MRGISSFTFHTTKALVVESGAVARLAEHLVPLGIRRPLLVTDRGVVAAGLLYGASESLCAAGLVAEVYQETEADPLAALVHGAAARAKEHGADSVIGLGGGSSMDIAKLVAVLADPSGAGQPLDEMYGVENVRGSRLPLVLVPTTAGTGSEVTPISIITTGPGEKKGVISHQLLPDLAILDGWLTAHLPPHVAASTGIDAMVHAIEAYTSRLRKNPLSDLLAREALVLLTSNIHAVCVASGEPEDPEEPGADCNARSAMLLGSCYAGMAFANAPVGAVHALAYPLGARFHLPHGLSISLMLPHVLDFNVADDGAAALYAELAPLVCGNGGEASTVRAFIDYFAKLPMTVGLPTTLRDVGVSEADLQQLAEDAMLQKRLLPNNPRKVKLDDALRLYRAALG